MNRVAVWVAQTAVGATALAQATPLTEADARLDPDIAAQPLRAMDLILGLEGMARGAKFNAPRSNVPRSNTPRFNAPGPLRHPMRPPRIP